MNGRPARRRPPAVVLGWASVLAVTVGLGVLGQAGDSTPMPPVATDLRSPALTIAVPLVLPGRPPTRPVATRPPIGEDGVMGGLVFGTAWTWLSPAASER